MKKTVFYCGNIVLKDDNKPHLLIQYLAKIFPHLNFYHYDPTEELPKKLYGTLILIDTVKGINKVTVFNTMNNFSPSPRVTLHDYDVLLNLKLMMKLKKIKDVIIIGIPQKGSLKDLLSQTEDILKTI